MDDLLIPMLLTCIIIIALIFPIAFLYDRKKSIEFKRVKAAFKASLKKYNVVNFIEVGKYVTGHHGIIKPIKNILISKSVNSFDIYERTPESIIPKGKINFNNVKDIVLEDASTFEKRVTLSRLFAVGIFAFALRKKEAHNIFYITILCQNGRFDDTVIFEFAGKPSSAEEANTFRSFFVNSINEFDGVQK